MIARLRGILCEKHPPFLLLDVHGVGYEIESPMPTFSSLPQIGKEVELYIHQSIREDAHRLYGFAERRDRDVFRLLLRVNGVGGRLALAILSGMDAVAFSRCVYEEDSSALERLPGVGKKTASRLIMEMRHRLEGLPAIRDGSGTQMDAIPPPAASPKSEAISALVALGFKTQEATRRIEGMDCTGLACEDIVRRALQAIGK